MSTATSLDTLERMLAIAEYEGIDVRTEWLAGVRGGLVRIGQKAILFVDQALSVPEQLESVRAALKPLDWSETSFAGEMQDLLAG